MNQAINIGLKVLAFAFLLFIIGFVIQKKKSLTCKNVKIEIVGDENGFKGLKNEIEKTLKADGYDELNGIKLSAIDLNKIEQMVEKNPFVKNAEVFSTLGGVINIKIEQRIPLVRIINIKGNSFYTDELGRKMPLMKNSMQHILVANGFIVESFDSQKTVLSPMAKSIVFTANKIAKDSVINAMCEQLYVNRNLEIEMVTRLGDHLVVLGDTTDLEEKFKKLTAFYREGYKVEDLNKYKSIDLKFKGQVVCKKRNENG